MITFDYITVFTAAQPVNKSVTINNGKPHKVMTSPQREMQARTVAVPDAEAFVEVLKEQNFQLPEGAKLGDAIQVSYTVNDSNQVSCRFTHERSGRHVEFTHCFGGAEGVGEDNVDLSDLLID